MDCPNCSKPMTEMDFGGLMVDVCKDGCHGLWFDWLELGKLDRNNEGSGTALEEFLHDKPLKTERAGKITCPRCQIPMFEHLYKASKSARVDECYNCGAFFLDQGELYDIRSNCMSDQEYNKTLDQLVQHIYNQNRPADPVKTTQRGSALNNLLQFFLNW